MTMRTAGPNRVVLECDGQPCQGSSMTNLEGPTLRDVVHVAVSHRWKVENTPEGVKHFCSQCGQLPEHELAVRLRETIALKNKNPFSYADRGAGDATGMLDSIVSSSAKARGDDNLKDNADGGFSLDFGDD